MISIHLLANLQRLVAIVFLLLPHIGSAQANSGGKNFAVKGKFYASVDDVGDVYVNGTKIHHCDTGETQSQEVQIQPGDRILVQLKSTAPPRYFMMVFVSTDRTKMVNFDRQALRCLPDPEVKDFTALQYSSFTKRPNVDKTRTAQKIPFKHKSEWVWGEFDTCALGSLITYQMITASGLK